MSTIEINVNGNTSSSTHFNKSETDDVEITQSDQNQFSETELEYVEKLPLSDSIEDIEIETEYPEGGLQAWLVVFGSWCVLCASLGLMNTLGIFQAYISTHQLSTYSEGTIGWIFSIYTFMAWFCGIFVGPLFDKYGPRWLICVGSVCVVGSMMLLGECTGKLLHIMLNKCPVLMPYSVLAFYPSLGDRGRIWNGLIIHTIHRCSRTLFQHSPRKCHRHSLHWWFHRRDYLSIHAPETDPRGRVSLELPYSWLSLFGPMHHCQHSHQKPSPAVGKC
jgi:hypothetical protein